MKKVNLKLMLSVVMVVAILAATFSVGALAATPGEVVTGIWNNNILPDAQTILNNVVFPVLTLIAGVVAVVATIVALVSYNKHKEVNYTWIIIAFVALVVAIAIPTFFWDLVAASPATAPAAPTTAPARAVVDYLLGR